ncbi:MAG: peptide chain release factor-like protein [Candidatus Omnitrophica bacterium]|nr:peptide chain release factor-like protein [Candidatus Omnitrophota bacterium]
MISPVKENFLREQILRLGVREEDITEKFVRSRGPGGQNVNKVSTCVHLKHLPTGIEVKCQEGRSQAQNRLLARQILLNKIEAVFSKNVSEEKSRLEKIRRQSRKRSLRAKIKILESKRRHSMKKSFRARVSEFSE